MVNLLMIFAGSIAFKVLAALGIGFVSYAALTTLAGAVSDNVVALYSGMGSQMLAIATMLGVGQAMGIVLGAIIARATFAAIPRLQKLTA